MKKHTSVDSYIQAQPQEVRPLLLAVRKVVLAAAPHAEEQVKYNMPTMVQFGKNLVHYAAMKNHIGLYPAPEAIIYFKNELAPYTTSKGAIQFPFSRALPLPLIRKIVRFRVSMEAAQYAQRNKR